jgi:hypothetical protein
MDYSLPTPAPYDGQSEVEEREDDQPIRAGDLQSSPNTPRSTSSPPIIHRNVDAAISI